MSDEALIERLREALAVIAYEQPAEPWLIAHNALVLSAQPQPLSPVTLRVVGGASHE